MNQPQSAVIQAILHADSANIGEGLESVQYPLVNTWRTWQFAQSLSKRTVDERVATVTRMANWCQTSPESATSEQISEWLAAGDWMPRTRWTYHRALSAWFTWLQLQDHRLDNPMLRLGDPKRPKSVPRPLSNADVARLLTTRMHTRTRAMVLLATFEGLRTFEIAKVRGEHFDLVSRTMTVTGKGGITATLPLHHRVVEHAYRMPRKGYWFPGRNGGHQRRESVGQTIKEAITRAGAVGSAHQLRHWFGTALVEAGVDLRTVQTLLRHQNLSSTEIYTQVKEPRRADAIQLLDPFQLSIVTQTISPWGQAA